MMEYEPQPSTEHSIDLLSVLNHHTVVRVIESANDQLRQHRADINTIENLTDEYDLKIRATIGADYFDREAITTGLVYTIDQRGNLTKDRLFLNQRKLIFYGPAVRTIDKNPEVVFEFCDQETTDYDETNVQSTYYMLPEDITQLELIPILTLSGVLKQHGKRAKEITSRPDFFLLSADDQYELLQTIVDEIDDDTNELIGFTYEVDAKYFMATYDDMPLSLEDTYSDQRQLDQSLKFTPQGTYEGVTFAEIIARPDECIESLEDFSLSNGTPCMQLRSDAHKVTYLVPIDALETINPVDD